MAYMIKWKPKDYLLLGRKVAMYNRKRSTIKGKYLPPLLDYEEVKSQITTRRELTRVVNSLSRFMEKGAEKIVELPSGEKVTKWEKNEIALQLRIAKTNIKKEMRRFEQVVEGSGGYTRAQMGSSEYRSLKATLKSLDNVYAKNMSEFRRAKQRIETLGVSDLSMKRAITYRNNYMEVLKKYEGYENYNKLMNRINKISNPESFYRFFSKDDITVDLTYQSDETMLEDAFNQFLIRLGIDI